MDATDQSQSAARPTDGQAPCRALPVGQAPAVLDTSAIFGGRTEVRLLHRGQEYRLRVTRQGKLILTK
jgi:hemin uptake protein HemP